MRSLDKVFQKKSKNACCNTSLFLAEDFHAASRNYSVNIPTYT